MQQESAEIDGGARLGVLDGLRAMAIFMVFYAHVSCFMPPELGNTFRVFGGHHMGWFLINGLIGVRLFFCLSGFLITRQLLPLGEMLSRDRRAERMKFVHRYLKKRFFRLTPAYYLVMTTIILIIMREFWPLSGAQIRDLMRDYACHLVFMQDYCGLNINPVFWSLAAEAKFYALAPFIVFVLIRFRPWARYLILGCALLLVLTYRFAIVLHAPSADLDDYFDRLWVPFYSSLDCLLSGMLCCFIWSDGRLRKVIGVPRHANALFAGGLLLLLFLMAGVPPPNSAGGAGLTLFTETGYFSLTALAFLAIMLGLLGGCAASRLFENRWPRGLALISYSVYLIHSSFGVLSWRIAERWVGMNVPQTELWLTSFAVLVFLTLPLSVLSYYFVERPFIEWSHKRSATHEDLTIVRGW